MSKPISFERRPAVAVSPVYRLVAAGRADFGGLSMTSGRGQIECSYADLVSVLGEPHHGASADGKVRAEWAFRYGPRPREVVTVYDYKQYGIDLADVRIWSVGGGIGQGVIPLVALLAVLGAVLGRRVSGFQSSYFGLGGE